MFIFKKLFCNHQFVLVSTFDSDIDSGVGYRLQTYHTLYCPKCKLSKDVLKHEYEKIVGIQEVDRQYKSNRSNPNNPSE